MINHRPPLRALENKINLTCEKIGHSHRASDFLVKKISIESLSSWSQYETTTKHLPLDNIHIIIIISMKNHSGVASFAVSPLGPKWP